MCDSLYFTERTDLNIYDNDSIELVFIEVTDVSFCKKIIGDIYRPPGNYIALFNIALESLMSIVTWGKYKCIIAGDYNIDLLISEQHIGTEHFVNNLFANSFVPLITKPTRYSTLYHS